MAVSFSTTILLLRLLDSNESRNDLRRRGFGVTRIYQDGLLEPDIYQACSNKRISCLSRIGVLQALEDRLAHPVLGSGVGFINCISSLPAVASGACEDQAQRLLLL